MRRLLILLLPLLLLPGAALALDAETQALETEALCQALPWTCGRPTVDPVHQLCESLGPTMHLIKLKTRDREPLTQTEVEAQRTWQASCLAWEKEQRREAEAKRRALQGYRPGVSATVDCITTTTEGPGTS